MKRRNSSHEFNLSWLSTKITPPDAAKVMDVGLSTMTKWVKQLRGERQDKTPKASPIAPEQIEIRELRKMLQRIEMGNKMLKNCPWAKPHKKHGSGTVADPTVVIFTPFRKVISPSSPPSFIENEQGDFHEKILPDVYCPSSCYGR
jgi:hypothetical protein